MGGRLTGLHPHGHGLGLEVRDYPIIVLDNGRRISDDCMDMPSDLAMTSADASLSQALVKGIIWRNMGEK